jgi:hypothetical protein
MNVHAIHDLKYCVFVTFHTPEIIKPRMINSVIF